MKHAVAFILIFALLLAVPGTASAETYDTTVTAVVPETYTLTIEASENVQVLVDGKAANGSAELHFLTRPVIQLVPKEGYEVVQVLLDGVDVTGKLKDGRLTLPEIVGAHSLTVKTQSEKRYDITGTILRDGKPLAGVKVELHSTVRTTTTDKEGGFVFKNVEEGEHTITVIQDGATLAATGLTITETNADFSYTEKDGGYGIQVPVEIYILDFTFELQEDEDGKMTMELTKLTGSKRPTASSGGSIGDGSGEIWGGIFGDNPKTGDIILASVAVMVLSGAGLVALLRWYKRKRKEWDEEDEA